MTNDQHEINDTNAAVLARIRKLLALATSSNPHEAALAAARAQALMFAHNITQDAITLRDPAADPLSAYEKVTTEIPGARAGSLNWRRLLANSVARTNFTAMLYVRGTNRMHLIGKPHNIEMTKYLVEYLTVEIDRLARQAWKDLPRYDRQHSNWLTWTDAFCRGATAIVAHRLQQQRQESEAAAPEASRALVVRHDQELSDATARHFPKTKTTTSLGSHRNASAFHAGVEAGRAIPLHRPIEGAHPGAPALPPAR